VNSANASPPRISSGTELRSSTVVWSAPRDEKTVHWSDRRSTVCAARP
jgi:hypothetical protein